MRKGSVTQIDRGATDYLNAGIIRVCMRCHPGNSIFEQRPEWLDLGLSISHGLCVECRDRMLADLDTRKEAA